PEERSGYRVDRPRSAEDKASHRIDTTDEKQFGEGNRLTIETFRLSISSMNRETGVINKGSILDHIEIIFIEIVGASQIRSPEIESDACSPPGPRIEIIVPGFPSKCRSESGRCLISQLLTDKQGRINTAGVIRITEIQLFRNQTDTSAHILREPPAECETRPAFLFKIGNVVGHAAVHVDLHGRQRVVQIGIAEGNESEGSLLAELSTNTAHPAVAAKITFGNISNGHQLVQFAESAADAELAGRFFFHSHVQIDFVRLYLLRQDFHGFKKIEIVEALKTPLE